MGQIIVQVIYLGTYNFLIFLKIERYLLEYSVIHTHKISAFEQM